MKIFLSILFIFYGFNLKALTFDEAKHLLNRSRFFYTKKDIQELVKLDRLKAARLAIGAYKGNAKYRIPPFLEDYRKRKISILKAIKKKNWKLFHKERDAFMKKYKPKGKMKKMMSQMGKTNVRGARRFLRKMSKFFLPRLQKWWIRKIIKTDEPFREVMTLFWHNHFTTSFKAVKDLNLLYEQNELWRNKALGSFGDLARSAIYDPALGLYLDLPKSKKEKPNENLARELFELFTLGIGNYSEKDIKEASKALTGFRYNRLKDVYFFRPKLHDDSEKIIFGKKGKFDPEDLIDIILEKPETSRFIVSKIWKEFVSPNLSKKTLDHYSKLFQKSNYDIRGLFLAIFTSDEFYSPKNRGTLIKSPLHFTLSYHSLLRELKTKPKKFTVGLIFRQTRRMGMELFNPPNVKGWPGHTNWINSNTLLLRKTLVKRFLRMKALKNRGVPFNKDKFIKQMAKTYLPLAPVVNLKKEKKWQRLRALLTGPVYQLR